MRHARPRRWTGQSPRHSSRPRPLTMLGIRGLRHGPRSVRYTHMSSRGAVCDGAGLEASARPK
eukprot:297738-Prymnesium_polylepis.1